MSHLLALSIGPVQEWIAAARRTRDLWFGSLVLSEISKAAAREIAKKATLIFPAEIPDGEDRIANVIIAEVEGAEQAQALLRDARTEAERKWLEFARAAKQRVQQHIDPELWDEQAADVIEFYAAWTPLSTYKDSRQKLMRLLAGRKACRTFRPVRGRSGVPKSSLDGARESVWLRGSPPSDPPDDLAIALRLSRGEQLDCIGLTKRLGAKQNFPSVSRIAADPWIRGLAPEDAKKLVDECRRAGADALGTIQGERYAKFPFDGVAVYRNRFPEIEEETGGRLRQLSATLEKLEKKYGTPDPYLAVLIADGDGMGKKISQMGSPQQHREFSANLAGFAKQARAEVEKCQGCLVYAGGDDVLAFVPVDRTLECARALHDSFAFSVTGATLSVGIAIGHFMQPLEDLLSYARKAESASKSPDRNGLAMHLHPRSGVPVKIRRRWQDDPDRRIAQWSAFFAEQKISSKAAYAIHELARDYKNWPEETGPGETIREDVVRLLGRKEMSREVKEQLRDQLKNVHDYKTLNDLVEELLIARRISTWKPRQEG